MKREIEFVKSAIEKLKQQGDVSVDEATYIFSLAVVVYAYEMGRLEGWYKSSFYDKFDYTELSAALAKWYDEVFARIINKSGYCNFITSIPSREICPPTKYMESPTSYMIKVMDMVWDKQHILKKVFKTPEHFSCSANEKMVVWIKNNVPLSFDVICYRGELNPKYGGIDFARFGLLDVLPTYEREIEKEKSQILFDIDIPFLRSALNEKTDTYSVICPLEYKEVLDAVADNAPIPEIPPEKADVYIPKDVAYINSLVSSLPVRDITEEEADNIYLLFKIYQALRIVALKDFAHFKQQAQNATEPILNDATEPILNALTAWYKTVEKELKKGRRGNFVYTLPSNPDMNLYQLRKPIKKCLETLPKEPLKVAIRSKEDLPIEDVFFDTGCITMKKGSNKSFLCETSRCGFYERNGANLKEWKPVLQYNEGFSEDFILNSYSKGPTIGKLRFAEYSLGIKYIIVDGKIAVKEKDYQKMVEVFKLSDSKIMEVAELIKQRMKEDRKKIEPLECVIKGVEIVYKAQKDQEEYLEENSWMDMTR